MGSIPQRDERGARRRPAVEQTRLARPGRARARRYSWQGSVRRERSSKAWGGASGWVSRRYPPQIARQRTARKTPRKPARPQRLLRTARPPVFDPLHDGDWLRVEGRPRHSGQWIALRGLLDDPRRLRAGGDQEQNPEQRADEKGKQSPANERAVASAGYAADCQTGSQLKENDKHRK